MIRRFARPYARAIIDVVGTPEKANALRMELSRFEGARRSSPELQELYANPGIEHAAKMKVTSAIAARLGLTPMAIKVLEILITNRRINDLGAINDGVAEFVRASTNTVAASVRTAHALSDAERGELQRTLEQKFGRKVDLEVEVDPELLGGFVARVGSEVYDASVVGKIEKFRDSLQ